LTTRSMARPTFSVVVTYAGATALMSGYSGQRST
jgi:hypothetical protein